jgi:hypothetical protein
MPYAGGYVTCDSFSRTRRRFPDAGFQLSNNLQRPELLHCAHRIWAQPGGSRIQNSDIFSGGANCVRPSSCSTMPRASDLLVGQCFFGVRIGVIQQSTAANRLRPLITRPRCEDGRHLGAQAGVPLPLRPIPDGREPRSRSSRICLPARRPPCACRRRNDRRRSRAGRPRAGRCRAATVSGRLSFRRSMAK